MKKSSLYYCLGLFFILLLMGIYSCRKSNSIDNNTVVETPYSLYFTDTAGALYVSNNGTSATVLFGPDGKLCRSLLVSGNNIFFAKDNLYFSTNNGQNFNSSFDSLNTSSNYNAFGLPSYAINGMAIDFNQSMLVTLPSWGNRLYSTTAAVKVSGGLDNMGVVHSDGGGNPGTWGLDGYQTYPAGSYTVSGVGDVPVRLYSFAQLPNGYLCALAFEYGPAIAASTFTNHIRYVRNFYLTSKTANWLESTSNPDHVSTVGTATTSATSSALPPTISSGKKDTSFFTLGSYNNRLIAIDQIGRYGAWYSDNYGANWYQYSGLPANTPLLCVASPFEQVCLIGTYGAGLYILNVNTNTWQADNVGLGSNLVVRNIAFKQNIYKNGTVQNYIYLATNQGIYQSTNGGLSWALTIAGNYVTIY